jgi:spore coat protein CotH
MNNIFKKIIAAILLLASISTLSCAGEHIGDSVTSPETAPDTEPEVPQVTQYLPEEPEEVSIPDDGIYILYAVNSSDAGSIKGEKLQEVSGGKKTKKVTAEPELGYKFVKWSDGVTDKSRSFDTAETSTVITAIFDYDILELPVVLINTETGKDVKSKTEYINADISMFKQGSPSVFWTAEIRGRGNNTWGYPKKSYKIKFTKKQQPFGLGSGNDRIWVLLANHCDQSLLRNHFAFELAKSFDRIDFAPSSTSVDVYLNGEYRGVYLLAEEIKVGGDRVDVSENLNVVDTGYLVELSAYSSGDWIFNVGPRQYQVRSDLSTDPELAQQQYKFIADYMNKCWDAVRSGDRAEIEKYIDLDSYIDTYLVEEITKNLDLGWDSYYLHKDRGGKLVLGPMWDFDLSFGNSNEGCEFYTDIYAGIDSRNGLGNPWYTEASKLEWFRELVVKRWDEVYDSIVSKLPEKILAEGQRGFNAYSRNFIKWQIFGTRQNRETQFITRLKNYKEHYEYFAEWIKNRIEWLDNYYHTDEYKNGDFIKTRSWGNWNWGNWGGAPENDIYGNDKTEDLMKKLKAFDGKVKLESAGAPGFGGEGPEKLFDGSAGSKYCYQVDSGDENEVIFSLEKEFTAKAYVFRTANDTSTYAERNPDKWVLYGRQSEDDEWVVIDQVDDGESRLDPVDFTLYAFEIKSPAPYKQYKLWVKNDSIMQLSDLILIG